MPVPVYPLGHKRNAGIFGPRVLRGFFFFFFFFFAAAAAMVVLQVCHGGWTFATWGFDGLLAAHDGGVPWGFDGLLAAHDGGVPWGFDGVPWGFDGVPWGLDGSLALADRRCWCVFCGCPRLGEAAGFHLGTIAPHHRVVVDGWSRFGADCVRVEQLGELHVEPREDGVPLLAGILGLGGMKERHVPRAVVLCGPHGLELGS